MIGMIVSRVLGYLRYKVIFYYYGRGAETDAFFGAFAVPDTLYMLASGGALTASFIPLFSELLEKGRRDEAWDLASSIWNILFVTVGLAVVAGMVFAPQLTRVIVPGFSGRKETFELCVMITRIIFPMVVFTSISALCNGMLHSQNHFTSPTIAWCLHNVVIIGATIAFHDMLGIRGVAYGVLTGALLMVMVQMPAIVRNGYRYRVTFGWRNPAVKQVFRLFLPAMIGLSISQINLMILPLTFGSIIGEGAVSALQGAVRLLMLPLGIFGSAISMAIFPTLSRHIGGGRVDQFRDTLVKGMSMTFVFSLPSVVVLVMMGQPLTRVLFGGGEFTVKDCVDTALALAYYTVGLPGHTAIQVISRGYYSLKDTRTPFYVGLFSVLIISIPFSLGVVSGYLSQSEALGIRGLYAVSKVSPFYYLGLMGKGLGFGGIALSVSLATLSNLVLLMLLLYRKLPGISLRGMWVSAGKIAVATFAMGVVVLVQMGLMRGYDPMAQLAVGGILSGGVFIVVARVLRVREVDEIIEMFLGRFRRKTPV